MWSPQTVSDPPIPYYCPPSPGWRSDPREKVPWAVCYLLEGTTVPRGKGEGEGAGPWRQDRSACVSAAS